MMLMTSGGLYNCTIEAPAMVYPQKWFTIGPKAPVDQDGPNEGPGDACYLAGCDGTWPCTAPTPYYYHLSSNADAKNQWIITGAMAVWLPDNPAEPISPGCPDYLYDVDAKVWVQPPSVIGSTLVSKLSRSGDDHYADGNWISREVTSTVQNPYTTALNINSPVAGQEPSRSEAISNLNDLLRDDGDGAMHLGRSEQTTEDLKMINVVRYIAPRYGVVVVTLTILWYGGGFCWAEQSVSKPTEEVAPLSSEAALAMARDVVRNGFSDPERQIPLLVAAVRAAFKHEPKETEPLLSAMTALQLAKPVGRKDTRDLAIELSRYGYIGEVENEWDRACNAAVDRASMILFRDAGDEAMAALYDMAFSLVPQKGSYFESSERRAAMSKVDWRTMALHTAGSGQRMLAPDKAVVFEETIFHYYEKTEFGQDEDFMAHLREYLKYVRDVAAGDPTPGSYPDESNQEIEAAPQPQAPPQFLSGSAIETCYPLLEALHAEGADPELRELYDTISSTTGNSTPAEVRQACEDLLASSKTTPDLKEWAQLHHMMQLCFMSQETSAKVDQALALGTAWLKTHPDHELADAVRTFLATQIAMVDTDALPASFEERMDMVDAVYKRSKRGPFCKAWFEAEQWHGKALEVLTEKAALERNNRDQAKLYEGVDMKDQAALIKRQKEIAESADLQRQWRLMLADNLHLKQEALNRVLAVYEATNGDAVLVANDLSRAPYGDLSPEAMKLTVRSTAGSVRNTEAAIASCQREYQAIMERESGRVSSNVQTP